VNEVRDDKPCQVREKLVPLLTSNNGNEVRDEQPSQALAKLVPLLTSNNGNEVRDEQFCQEETKLVTLPKKPSVAELIIKLLQPLKAPVCKVDPPA
jgi:hypothetical protein